MKIAAPLLIVVLSLSAFAQEPSSAQDWFDLGVKRSEAGDFRGAAAAWEKARDAGYLPRVTVDLHIAGAWARAGDVEKAFAQLQRIAAAGFGSTERLLAADDLLALHGDPRWKPLLETMTRNAHPCRHAPEFRQFDYWLGEWDVEIGGRKLSQSSVRLILDDCVIFENYTDSRGYAGKSFSLWDRGTGKWEQRYVDSSGVLSEWTGGLADGVMVFYSKSTRNGVETAQRMQYVKEGPDRVRQVIDVSRDGGKTWSPGFNGLYIRRQ